MTELFSNLGQTTINQVGGIGATDTTVTVAALNGTNPANAFPSSGNFRVVIGTDASSEITLCTSVDSVNKIFTIVRGQEGTLAKAWPNGTSITISVTAQSFNQARAELFQVGMYNNRPIQGLTTGSYYQTVDGHTPWIWDSNVGAWRPQINGVLGYQPPPASLFSIGVNQGTATLVDSGKGALDFTNVSDAPNTVPFHGYFFNFTGGPCFIEACISHQTFPGFGGTTWIACGPALRESSTGKLCFFGQSQTLSTGVPYIEFDVYSNPTTRTSSSSSNTGTEPSQPMFLRLRYDGKSIYSDASRDRVVWYNTTTTAVGSIFTTAPNQIGFGGFSTGSAGFSHILSYTYGPLASPVINIGPPPQLPPPAPPAFRPVGYINPILNR